MPETPEPLVYPSRNMLFLNPAIPDRQVWAVGMVVIQWSLTEYTIEHSINTFVGDDKALQDEYRKARRFPSKLDFWETQLALKAIEPLRSAYPELIRRTKDLSAQRDEVVHRAWGGGMQSRTWSSEDYASTDAALLRKTSDKQKTSHGDARDTVSWRLDFGRLRKMARDMAMLNRDLMVAIFSPGQTVASSPHKWLRRDRL
ncbi:MAG: hypothetical protein JO134_06150 [Xanthobacteraceae bacterium]|nr:hypothetical protein [Xanthobacteraceae bacterium]